MNARCALRSIQRSLPMRSSAAAQCAGSTVGVLVDLDVGFHRTGVQDAATAVAVAQHVSKKPGLRFDGLFFYPGHLKAGSDPVGHKPALEGIAAQIQETIDALAKAGLKVSIVSGGSTPTAFQSHFIPQMTEIRPGTYLFYDWNWRARPGECR